MKMLDNQQTSQAKPALVPWHITIGLGVFTFLLAIAGFGFRWLFGEPMMAVLVHALKVVPVFLLGIPALMCVGAYLMNHIAKANIAMRNAWTLGWLLSVVALLSIMGAYS